MSLIGEIGGGRLTSAAKAVQITGQMESAEISGSLVQPELSGVSEQPKIAAQLERIIHKGGGNITLPDIDHVLAIDRADFLALAVKDPRTLYLIRG